MKSKFRQGLSLILLLSVLLPACMVISFALPVDLPFKDVKQEDWFYDDVVFAYDNGLMTGVAEDAFAPNMPLSRAMIVKILYNLAGEPDVSTLNNPFNDVPEDSWYADSVKWAYSKNIVAGREFGIFAPDDDITRNDLTAILLQYSIFADLILPELRNYLEFNDESQILVYAKTAVKLLYQAEVISGKPGNLFDPSGNATRAEMATMLHKFLMNSEKQSYDLLEKYGLVINVIAYRNNMPSTDPGYERGQFMVRFTSITNAEFTIPEISVTAQITSMYNTIDAILQAKEHPAYYKLFNLGQEDASLLKMTDGEYLTAVITVTIGDESQTYIFHPKVSSVS